MPEDLPRLARALRQETCPRRVIDEAVRRIAAETPPPSRVRYAAAVTVALASAMLLCGLLVRARLEREQQAQRRVQAACQAETALSLIGTALLQAGAQSETLISERALPTLRKGLQTAKDKTIRPTEL